MRRPCNDVTAFPGGKNGRGRLPRVVPDGDRKRSAIGEHFVAHFLGAFGSRGDNLRELRTREIQGVELRFTVILRYDIYVTYYAAGP